ncbi:hypothetical protein E4U21_006034 [Claviceps maximensis]|nr:hypothetical protein E4U21_006034 [Claviceps maximensis]
MPAVSVPDQSWGEQPQFQARPGGTELSGRASRSFWLLIGQIHREFPMAVSIADGRPCSPNRHRIREGKAL